jgi:dinuclear metal center YbgI/SA1388 family protein
MPIALASLTAYLDDYLRVAEVPDDPKALNGLQVDGGAHVQRVLAAVDACQATIDAAVQRKAHLLLVHHGLFWGGAEPVTGRHGRRLRTLIQHDVAVYSAHLPLDVHPDVGNNAVLARALGIEDLVSFGDYHGVEIGFIGRLEVSRDDLVSRVRAALGVAPHVVPAGPEGTARVAVITGGGGSMIRDALDAGADSFVTGEGAHHTYFDAEEWGLNVLYAGHYATETVGVKALAAHLEQRFGIEWQFFDHPTGL